MSRREYDRRVKGAMGQLGLRDGFLLDSFRFLTRLTTHAHFVCHTLRSRGTRILAVGFRNGTKGRVA